MAKKERPVPAPEPRTVGDCVATVVLAYWRMRGALDRGSTAEIDDFAEAVDAAFEVARARWRAMEPPA